MKNKGAKLVSGDILGLNIKNVEVGGKFYSISPPTIEKISGAAYYLSNFDFIQSKEELVHQMQIMKDAASALSWFIEGNDSLSSQLSKGTIDEICNGIDAALSLIDIENFKRLSVLAGNVARLAAKPKS